MVQDSSKWLKIRELLFFIYLWHMQRKKDWNGLFKLFAMIGCHIPAVQLLLPINIVEMFTIHVIWKTIRLLYSCINSR